MNKIRIWHSSRDPYHCTFRMLRILIECKGFEISVEHLRLLDMYLLFPTLLHGTSMPLAIRQNFNSLNIPKKNDIFVNLPSAASVFQDLRIYQNAASSQMTARGLLDAEKMRAGVAALKVESLPAGLLERVKSKNEAQSSVVKFLTSQFVAIPLRGKESIYRRAGLPGGTLAA